MMVDRDLLTRYFLGECSEVEKEAIRAWLEADASHGREFARERIRFDATLLIDEGRLPSYRAAWGWRRVGMVAAVALACVLPWLVHELLRPSAVMQEVYAPPGNRAQVLLPDGSQAWLYGNSRLRYPSVFVGGDRRVELDGEAWFEVSASAGRRFVLSAGGYEIEALGTAFNVDAYSSGGAFSAALFEGSVRLHRAGDAGRELYLRPGQKAERVGDSLLVFPANINAYRMREGIIVIEDKPFEEIMEIFEKYYGLEIVVQNERLRGLGYRGKFRMSDGVEHALNVLRKDFRFAYSRPDSVNIIYIY